MIKYEKWAKNIVILFIVGSIFNANAKDINCSLNTDCTFSFYDDYIYVPTGEKADYKCHILQKNNVSAHGAKPVINLITGYGSIPRYSSEEIELGGNEGNEGNLYFPSRMIEENGKLTFIVEEKSPYYVNKIADITINCTKI